GPRRARPRLDPHRPLPHLRLTPAPARPRPARAASAARCEIPLALGQESLTDRTGRGSRSRAAVPARGRYAARVTLRLFDSATRELRDFTPRVPGEVGLYVCGATPQSPPHNGHLRTFVAFHVLLAC